MKEEPTKNTADDHNDASLKFKLYLSKIVNEALPQATIEKVCHLAVQNFLKFADSEEFVKENYDRLKALTYEKKNYYLLYLVDTLVKNNKYFMSMARKDLEGMFKAVWQKVSSESKKDNKLGYMKAMAKTWGVIYLKKYNIQQNLKKWLSEKYETNLNLPQRMQALFEQSFEKQKIENDSKLQQLLSELSKQEPSKKSTSTFIDLKQKIFQD